MPTSVCPKCAGRFEEGFIVDHSQHARIQSRWIEGKPERSFWQGVKVRGRAQHPVVCLRCTRCGFLESYAPLV